MDWTVLAFFVGGLAFSAVLVMAYEYRKKASSLELDIRFNELNRQVDELRTIVWREVDRLNDNLPKKPQR